ncbi:hypothetical protein ENKNEFLB_01398 [Nocardioides aquaticus]|uniref:GNAT family N-acetyltransferase n=2 Tax=Nocardioides aquaticus TaxID=160826 RepID=A0ABX8EET6_9ACTN|nr:hypothetical protein ENKNEFLB_01398 [Nocardioides aquaticus]
MLAPGERWVCGRHATEDDRALVEDLDRRGPSVGLAPSPRRRRGEWAQALDWPYDGPRRYLGVRRDMVAWAEARGLRLWDGCWCLCWVRDGVCREDHGGCRPAWLDHVTCWTGADGLRLLVAHPYVPFSATAGLHGLGVAVARQGWHPGALQVEISSGVST